MVSRDPIDRLLLIVAVMVITVVVLAIAARADCPPEGEGGDPDLNALKNRTMVPTGSVRPMTVTQVAHFAFQGSRQPRARWTAQQRADVAKLETTAVVVTGYLVGAKQEKAEAANCGGPGRDLHLFLAETDDAARSDALVVEVTPHAHPATWTLAAMRKLVRAGRPVRITGWLMFDEEHVGERGRLTPWEIHPVTGIEVFVGQAWRAL